MCQLLDNITRIVITLFEVSRFTDLVILEIYSSICQIFRGHVT